MSKFGWKVDVKAEKDGSFFVELEVSENGIPMGGFGWPMSRETMVAIAEKLSQALASPRAAQ